MKSDFESIDDFEDIGGTVPKKLPHASGVLVLGILSIVTCWIYGIIGIILAIIAMALHKSDKRVYAQNRASYQQSFETSTAGKICAIIGLVLSGLIFFMMIIIVIALVNRGGLF